MPGQEYITYQKVTNMNYETLLYIVCSLILLQLAYQIFFAKYIWQRLIDEKMDHWREKQSLHIQTLKHDLDENRRDLSILMRDVRTDLEARMDKSISLQMHTVEKLGKEVKVLTHSNETRFDKLARDTTSAVDKIREEVTKRLEGIQKDNERQLEKMRRTVDEKLHHTLEERLGRSFRLVSDHLEKVQKGLGEMQSLAAGVGDLKKVLSNVKTRGILGEIQLLNIIEEIMTPEQYSLNARVVSGSDRRVEVAIKLPGKDADRGQVLLPIDSKFPLDKYQKLVDAYETGCSEIVSKAKSELNRALLTSAKEIKQKYIFPPHTTDFAIMFLPVEGLYAEVCRHGSLLNTLRTEYQILVAGPSNLSAFLSSLQMGFRTLAIEKRSSEVWTILGEIKTEFGKFGYALEKVQKKLNEATNVIDQAGVRRRVLERKLSKVEELPEQKSLVVNSVL